MWDLKPSFVRELLSLMEDPVECDLYFEYLMEEALFECNDTITLIDDFWVYGVIHREALNKLSDKQIEALDNVETNKARCFMNGYRGLDWDNGLML